MTATVGAQVGAVRVLYQDGVPLEVAGILQPLFDKWLKLVPTWCHEIEVSWNEPDETEQGVVLAICPSVEYRRAEFAVFPKWLTEKKASREQAVVHELVHLLLAPLTEFYDDVIDRLGAKLAEYVRTQHERAFESVVVDVTNVLTAPRRRKA
jgi:hypothetical protein